MVWIKRETAVIELFGEFMSSVNHKKYVTTFLALVFICGFHVRAKLGVLRSVGMSHLPALRFRKQCEKTVRPGQALKTIKVDK